MRRTILASLLAVVAAGLIWAQSFRIIPDAPARFEVRTLLPREISPGAFEQVEQRTLDQLGSDGWELVSVTPYVYRNEEYGQPLQAGRQVVTQTYTAYFFKRVRATSRQ
jgi:hypothetical protein